MKNGKGIRTLSVIAIAVAIVAISVGYAALSQTLNINGTTNVKQTDWSVKFQNLSTPVIGGSGVSESTDLSATTFTFAASLTKPGDSVTYVWDVTNDGDIDAKLYAAPVLTGVDTAATSHVSYSFTYNDGTSIAANDALNAGDTKKIRLVISYDSDATSTATTDTALALTTTLTYVQA